MLEYSHIPVMLREVIDGLNILPNGIYCDLTLGGGSHSEAIAEKLTTGKLISFDRDADAIQYSSDKLSKYADRITFVHDNYANIKADLASFGIAAVNGVLIDAGVSSYQIDNAERGFSFSSLRPAVIDMRMDQSQPLDAKQVVNTYDKATLADIFFKYGEERYSNRIADAIVKRRESAPIETTTELSNIIEYAVRGVKTDGSQYMRIYQALRIYVNGELDALQTAINDAVELLVSGGRLCAMSFHSGEDRILKKSFNFYEKGCTCPVEFPVCVCGNKPIGKVITRSPIVPGDTELRDNPRSHSAKLRIFEKI
ncbi:ribosomal RNA small subunit methyltransferase H [Clostridia bacterium]|nr:ribosomal RNA small subunit methyltransferase H [Clostridia bacterium]